MARRPRRSGLDASRAPAPNQRIFERRSCWQAAFDLLADETFQGVAGSSLRELRGAPFWRTACKRRARERPQLLLHAFPQLRRLQVGAPPRLRTALRGMGSPDDCCTARHSACWEAHGIWPFFAYVEQ